MLACPLSSWVVLLIQAVISRVQWQTTWDRSKLYTSLKPSSPINFGSPGAIGAADIDVDDTQTYQSVWGFGGSLSEHRSSSPLDVRVPELTRVPQPTLPR